MSSMLSILGHTPIDTYQENKTAGVVARAASVIMTSHYRKLSSGSRPPHDESAAIFLVWGDFKMADSSSDVEINVDDVCDSMAAGDEVETIIQGQAPLPGQADELDFMVQEEVETTTDGDTLTVELDPVDNVIIALQNTDGLQGGGHFDEQNGGLCETLAYGSSSSGIVVGRERPAAAGGGRKRRSGSGAGAGGGGEGGGRLGASAKKKSRKMRKGAVSVRFTNRQMPTVLSSSAASKETREANEASFDASKSPRRWRRRSVPVTTLEGQFAVAMWSTGTYVSA